MLDPPKSIWVNVEGKFFNPESLIFSQLNNLRFFNLLGRYLRLVFEIEVWFKFNSYRLFKFCSIFSVFIVIFWKEFKLRIFILFGKLDNPWFVIVSQLDKSSSVKVLDKLHNVWSVILWHSLKLI